MPTPGAIDQKSRKELLEEARRMGVERPERMTRVELRDEIVRRSTPESEQSEARGLFGVARSMLASVVESGLNLPDAARLIRGQSTFDVPVASQTPVATVTLAEIYAAQGHKDRALRILEDVLREEPGHEEALRVQAELRELRGVGAKEPSVALSKQDRSREAATVEAPPVAEMPAATTEYVPGGFVETTGEEVETGRPPEVQEVEPPPPVEPAPPLAEATAPLAEATAPLAEATAPLAEPAPSPPRAGPAAEPPTGPALALHQTGSGLSIYWELPESTLAQCSIDPEDGRAVVRVVGFSPSGPTPRRGEETIILSETIKVEAPEGCDAGKLRVGHFGAPFAVRAALGWETADGFLPFVVGRSLDELRADVGSRGLAGRASEHLASSRG